MRIDRPRAAAQAAAAGASIGGAQFGQATSDAYALGATDVHVWRAELDTAGAHLSTLQAVLARDEVERSERFRFDVHRNRFVACRGILRLLLSRYLQLPPQSIALEASEYGKPFLASRHRTDLTFNVSHSHELALIAVARARALGVDVEHMREGFAEDTLAERFFAPGEVAALRALPRSRQMPAFFECWVRKEAYVKARGTGLSTPLDSFDVSFGDGKPARLLRTAPDAEEAKRWTIEALDPGPDYAAALVVAGKPDRLRCWRWAFPERSQEAWPGRV